MKKSRHLALTHYDAGLGRQGYSDISVGRSLWPKRSTQPIRYAEVHVLLLSEEALIDEPQRAFLPGPSRLLTSARGRTVTDY